MAEEEQSATIAEVEMVVGTDNYLTIALSS